MRRFLSLLVGLVACGGPPRELARPETPPSVEAARPTARDRCGGAPLAVHFLRAGQGLAAALVLPDGRRILVDTGESPTRPGCAVCPEWHAEVIRGLERLAPEGRLDMIWATHPHSDHLGGAPNIFERFSVGHYVDNGETTELPVVVRAREAARRHGVHIRVVDAAHPESPLPSTDEVRLQPIVPRSFPRSCKHNPNDCSIGLRVDYCQSSILFTGDAESAEEAMLPVKDPVTLLQVAHHGSDTSSTESFLARARPRYAVVASANPDEGTNAEFCHPRQSVVERLTRVLGGPGRRTVPAFAGTRCRGSTRVDWAHVPVSDRLYFTREGEVALVTHGDGSFSLRGEAVGTALSTRNAGTHPLVQLTVRERGSRSPASSR